MQAIFIAAFDCLAFVSVWEACAYLRSGSGVEGGCFVFFADEDKMGGLPVEEGELNEAGSCGGFVDSEGGGF